MCMKLNLNDQRCGRQRGDDSGGGSATPENLPENLPENKGCRFVRTGDEACNVTISGDPTVDMI